MKALLHGLVLTAAIFLVSVAGSSDAKAVPPRPSKPRSVPEPATLGLAAAGVVALVAARRRNK